MSKSLIKHKDNHIARILAVQYLFTYFKSKELNYEGFFEPNSILEEIEEKKFNTKLYEELVEGVVENQKKIDKMIGELAPKWPLSEINLVNLNILRIAIFEGFIGELTEKKIVINEAVLLSKELSSEESSGFTNGVLGALVDKK